MAEGLGEEHVLGREAGGGRDALQGVAGPELRQPGEEDGLSVLKFQLLIVLLLLFLLQVLESAREEGERERERERGGEREGEQEGRERERRHTSKLR